VKLTSSKLIAPENLGLRPPEGASSSSGRFSTEAASLIEAPTSS
jgi:hypothetical protein